MQAGFDPGGGYGRRIDERPAASSAALPGPDLGRPLSERERDILQLVEAGYSNREIAQRLYLGKNTVKWYLQKLYRAFDVTTREACVQRARELSLLA